MNIDPSNLPEGEIPDTAIPDVMIATPEGSGTLYEGAPLFPEAEQPAPAPSPTT